MKMNQNKFKTTKMNNYDNVDGAINQLDASMQICNRRCVCLAVLAECTMHLLA